MGQASGLAGTNVTMLGHPAGLSAEGTDLGVLVAATLTVGNTLRMNEGRLALAAQGRSMVASPGRAGCGRDGRWRRASISAEKTRKLEPERREHQHSSDGTRTAWWLRWTAPM